jgi:carbonic anhydrase
LLLAGCDDPAHGPVHWGYETHNGPAVWAQLSPEYALCAEGQEQSPIDLSKAKFAEPPTLAKDYKPASLKIIRHEHVVDVIDNGHTIQVNYDEGSVLQVGEQIYTLQQFHFHAPSEHTIGGRHFPMEVHLVHQSSDGELAVVGLLVAEGAYNPAFEPIWDHLPDEPGQEVHLEQVQVHVDDLLPTNRETYRYRGSLTTPPCSEGVSWLVAAEAIELAPEQISQFTSIIPANNRPVQRLGARTIRSELAVD